MIIQQVDTFPLYFENPRPYGDANGLKHYRSCFLIRILTKSGLEGWGECIDWLPVLQIGFQQRIIPFLIGKNALHKANLLLEVEKWHSRSAAAVSMALTEIAARGANINICDLWGGSFREEIPVYASFQSYGVSDKWVKESVDMVEKSISQGFSMAKVKVGGKSFWEDVSHIDTLLRAFPTTRFALDANQSYDASTARKWREILSGNTNILWFEEPLPIRLVEDYKLLRNSLLVSIAGGENLQNVPDFLYFLRKGALDIIQPDLMHLSGVDRFRRVLDLARDFGVRISPHTFDGPLSRLYTLMAMACLPPWSKMKGEDIEPVEWDVMESPFHHLFPLSPTRGKVSLPKGVGIGMEPDTEILAHYKWQG